MIAYLLIWISVIGTMFFDAVAVGAEEFILLEGALLALFFGVLGFELIKSCRRRA